MPASVYNEPPLRGPALETTTTLMGGGGHVHRRMVAQQHISTDQAAKQLDDAPAKLAQAKAQAVQAAKNTADATATAAAHTSFAAFADLLIGAIAAAIGGSLAVQRRMHVARRVV